MNIERKPRERMRAQVEQYIDSATKNYPYERSGEKNLYFQYSAMIAGVEDLDNLPEEMPGQVKDFVRTHYDAFVAFLRNEDRALTIERERAVARYEELRPAIAALREKVEGPYGGKNAEEFLGNGSNNSVYKLTTPDGEYAVKFSKSPTGTNFEIRPLLRAKGLENVAQCEAYDIGEDNVTVMSLMPGKDMNYLRTDARPQVMSDHAFIELMHTVEQMTERGLVIDPKASNFLFNAETDTVSVVDFHMNDQGRTAGEQIHWLLQSLSSFDVYQARGQSYDWSDGSGAEEKRKEMSIAADRVRLPRMLHMLRLLRDFAGDRFQEMLHEIREKQADKSYSGVELISTRYMHLDDPVIAGYIEQFAAMDDPENPWLLRSN